MPQGRARFRHRLIACPYRKGQFRNISYIIRECNLRLFEYATFGAKRTRTHRAYNKAIGQFDRGAYDSVTHENFLICRNHRDTRHGSAHEKPRDLVRTDAHGDLPVGTADHAHNAVPAMDFSYLPHKNGTAEGGRVTNAHTVGAALVDAHCGAATEGIRSENVRENDGAFMLTEKQAG